MLHVLYEAQGWVPVVYYGTSGAPGLGLLGCSHYLQSAMEAAFPVKVQDKLPRGIPPAPLRPSSNGFWWRPLVVAPVQHHVTLPSLAILHSVTCRTSLSRQPYTPTTHLSGKYIVTDVLFFSPSLTCEKGIWPASQLICSSSTAHSSEQPRNKLYYKAFASRVFPVLLLSLPIQHTTSLRYAVTRCTVNFPAGTQISTFAAAPPATEDIYLSWRVRRTKLSHAITITNLTRTLAK